VRGKREMFWLDREQNLVGGGSTSVRPQNCPVKKHKKRVPNSETQRKKTYLTLTKWLR